MKYELLNKLKILKIRKSKFKKSIMWYSKIY